jgi:UDP-N-acetylglucosamine 3-dehydrogenase
MKQFICAVQGYGKIGIVHCKALTQMAHVSRIIVIEIDSLKRQNAILASPKIVAYSDLNECLKLERHIDYLVISTPIGLHFENLCEGIDLGFNILVEKPFVPDIKSAISVIQLSQHHDSIIGVGLVERFNPVISKVKQTIDSGIIGRVLEIQTRRWGAMPTNREFGVLLDLAPHDVDICRFLLSQEYQDIFLISNGEMDKESTAIITAKSSEGSLISNSVSWINSFKMREIMIFGEEGSIQVDTSRSEATLFRISDSLVENDNLKVIMGEKSSHRISLDHVKSEPMVNQHLAFQSAIISNSLESIITLGEAYKSLLVIESAKISRENKLPPVF